MPTKAATHGIEAYSIGRLQMRPHKDFWLCSCCCCCLMVVEVPVAVLWACSWSVLRVGVLRGRVFRNADVGDDRGARIRNPGFLPGQSLRCTEDIIIIFFVKSLRSAINKLPVRRKKAMLLRSRHRRWAISVTKEILHRRHEPTSFGASECAPKHWFGSKHVVHGRRS
jgi:hypothetical protein